MSQEPEEDVKPKLNLNITYEGQRTYRALFEKAANGLNSISFLDVTVKVKANMKFAKIFEVVEVSRSLCTRPASRYSPGHAAETIPERTRCVPMS
jgi:hypothetical protein